VAIFTANGDALNPMLDEIARACGVAVSDKRYIVVGCEKVPGFEAVALGEKVDTVKVEPGSCEEDHRGEPKYAIIPHCNIPLLTKCCSAPQN
jgi:hypothetical protein